MPAIDAKRATLVEYKRSPNVKSLQALRAARAKVQQTARKCANEFWQQLSNDIQIAAATGNIKRMYEGIKLTPTELTVECAVYVRKWDFEIFAFKVYLVLKLFLLCSPVEA